MILLSGQSANATVKRDASNNILYGITGTDDASDKIVYSRGVNATIPQLENLTNTGTSTVNKLKSSSSFYLTFSQRGLTYVLHPSSVTGYVLQAGALICNVPDLYTINVTQIDTIAPVNSITTDISLPAATGQILRTQGEGSPGGNRFGIQVATRRDGESHTSRNLYTRTFAETMPAINSNNIDAPVRDHNFSVGPAAPLTVQNTANWGERNILSGSVSWNVDQNIPVTLQVGMASVANYRVETREYNNTIQSLSNPVLMGTSYNWDQNINYYVIMYRVILRDDIVDSRVLTNVLDSVNVRSTRANSDGSSYIAEVTGKNTTLPLTQTS